MKVKGTCLLPVPTQDKGYAWLVLVMSVLSHFAHAGFSFGVVGNLTIVHQKVFGINLQQSGTIGTVHVSMVYLCGPLASVMINKFGSRPTQILGGFAIILGIGMSALSTELWHGVVLIGLIAGFGVSSCYSASSQVLALCFKRFKYIAFASAMIGYSSGVVGWPIISQYLLDKYGYSKAMGIMSSVHIFHIIAGLTFPVDVKDVHTGTEEEKSEKDGVRPHDSKVIGSIANTAESDPSQVTGSENGAFDNLACAESVLEAEESVHVVTGTETRSSLRDDFRLLFTSWKVWLLIVGAMFWSANASGFIIFINDYVVQKTNMDTTEAAVGITIMGVAHIVGNIAVLVTGTLRYDRLALHALSILVFGAMTILSAFTNSKEMYYSVTACFGLAFGVTLANLLGVIHDLCGVKYVHLGFGLELLFEGVGNLGFVSLAAYLSEDKGERYGLILSGCFGILCSIIFLPAIVYRITKKQDSVAIN